MHGLTVALVNVDVQIATGQDYLFQGARLLVQGLATSSRGRAGPAKEQASSPVSNQDFVLLVRYATRHLWNNKCRKRGHIL